jgi:hypothetical protein
MAWGYVFNQILYVRLQITGGKKYFSDCIPVINQQKKLLLYIKKNR